MKRLGTLLAVILAGTIVLWPSAAAAQTETSVTGAAAGIYPSGTTFNGVPISGLKFGIGVLISGEGSALGQFQTTLAGLSALGQEQNIEVDGRATSGSVGAAGTATFSGRCTLNMGDGSLPINDLPFAVTIVTNAQGQGTLALVLGATSLPAATVNEGSMMIK